MNENEILVNDEVIEETEEIAKRNSGTGLKKAAGIGLTLLVGGIAYKFAIKPIAAKIKAKRASRKIEVKDNNDNVVPIDISDVE